MKFLCILLIFIFTNLFSKELITPLHVIYDYDTKKAQLGRVLFHDKRLSKDNAISCASCHDLANGGDDNRKFSLGVGGEIGSINSPTVLNSRFNFVQFWDGRAKDLKEQVLGPIHNLVEMNTNFNDIVNKLKQDIFYVESFKENYGKLDEDSIIDAIVEFEKALVTPNSKFDKYLLGNEDILSSDEKEGFTLFKDLGCISCHNGVNIGGNLFQKMGIVKEYKTSNNNLGRYNVTKEISDKYYFKVPSLRNIEHTAPYLHDGSEYSLKNVIRIMLDYQVGFDISNDEIKKIELFLKTLSGETPAIMNDK